MLKGNFFSKRPLFLGGMGPFYNVIGSSYPDPKIPMYFVKKAHCVSRPGKSLQKMNAFCLLASCAPTSS